MVTAVILPAASAHIIGKLLPCCKINIPAKCFGFMIALRAVIAVIAFIML